jgi:uncharacterized protein (UPF0335 family)
MADTIGKNTPNSELLSSFISRIERIDEEKKALADDRKAIIAEARSAGFNVTQGLNYVLKVRKMKPHDRQEAEAVRDIYMHAMGMDNEPPLFRQLGAMAADQLTKDKLTASFKLLVPPNSEIILKCGGLPMRFWRDKDGEPQAEEYEPPAVVDNVRKQSTLPPASKKDVPDCTPEAAETLGEQAARANKPVIDNPFPFGDERRARFDEGWRRAAGNDGMGPGSGKP